MTDTDLRDNLAAIASQARPVDLYERSLSRSRQLRKRRAAISVVGAVAVLALASVVSAQFLPGLMAGPLPPASPGPAATLMIGTDATDELAGAVLTIPPWPAGAEACPSGKRQLGPNADVTLIGGHAIRATLGGERAVVVTLVCWDPNGGGPAGQLAQVVAYRITAANNFELLGTVVRTEGEIDEVAGGVASRNPEEILVQVRHRIVPGEAAPEFSTIAQFRTYMWTGTVFAQTSGPRSFAVSAERQAAVTVTTTDLTFGKLDGAGCRTGTMKVTVRNSGATPMSDLSATVAFPPEVYAQDDPVAVMNCPHQTNQGTGSAQALIPTVPASGTVTTTITIVIHGSAAPGVVDAPTNVVQLHSRGSYGEQYFPATQRFTVIYG